MCSISVEPMPSTMSRSKQACQRRSTSGASGSAALTQKRTDERSNVDASGRLTIAPYSVGHREEQRRPVRAAVSSSPRGSGLPGRSTVVAPTEYGNVRLLPSPYAW